MVNDLQTSIGSSRLVDVSATYPSTVYVVTTVKGGAGKTETAECLEAISTFSGFRSKLVDVDDGNRGLARRVGLDNVIKVEWCTSVLAAPNWLAKHGADTDTMIFDLGAGIDSSDLPVMAFLSSVWRMLAERGARVIICAVVSTNAPTSNYVERLERRFGELGEVVIVCNNQDGSAEYPEEVTNLPQTKIHLARLPSGIQAVRMRRREKLSQIVRIPTEGFKLASALMAKRILAFADQPFFKGICLAIALGELRRVSNRAPTRLFYTITKAAVASDSIIEQNVRLADADAALRRPGIDDAEILAAALDYRLQHALYRKLASASPAGDS